MKVLVIYYNDSKEEVQKIRQHLVDECKVTVLRMRDTDRNVEEKKRKKIRHYWHKNAKKLIAEADLILYAFSKNSYKSVNVRWELKYINKLKKYLVCVPVKGAKKEDLANNNTLYYFNDSFQKKTLLSNIEYVESEKDLYDKIEKDLKEEYIKLFNSENVDREILLEQYKIFSGTAETLLERRQNMNSFFISANMAIITIAGSVFVLSEGKATLPKLILIFAISLPGILLNISWKRSIKSYGLNNKGKIKVLSMIEKKLAASLYDSEWKAMKNKYSREKYTSFTDNELKLPIIFACFFGLADIVSVVGFILIKLGVL